MFVSSVRILFAFFSISLMTTASTMPPVKLISRCPEPGESTNKMVCNYTIRFCGMTDGSLITLALQIPRDINVFDSSDCNYKTGTEAGRLDSISRKGRYVFYKFKTTKSSGCVCFKVKAPKDDYKVKEKSYSFELGETYKRPRKGEAEVPVRKEKISTVRPWVGAGFTYLKDDFVDFKEVREGDTHIFTDNDSRLRAELMAGALFKLYEFKNNKTLDFVSGLEFAQGGQNVLDGIFFGLGFGLNPKIEFIGGFSRSRGKELSPGFQRAMGQFIMKNKRRKKYPQFRDIDLVDGVIADIKDYDGLPLTYEEKVQKIYPGNPITNSFNSKFSFGILVPLEVWKLFKDDDES